MIRMYLSHDPIFLGKIAGVVDNGNDAFCFEIVADLPFNY